MTFDNPLIVGDFYEGANGPTILLILNSIKAATWLRQVFIEQADRAEPRDLAAEPEVRVSNLEGLRLATRVQGSDIELKRDDTGSNGATFVLAASERGWRDVADLIEPFTNGRPGHQYFPDLAGDDAVIEVSFGESHRDHQQ